MPIFTAFIEQRGKIHDFVSGWNNFCRNFGVSLLDIFVSYLAIGAAFAMRAYFLNRRRPLLTKARVVFTQFFLWLPIWLIRLAKGNIGARRRRIPTSAGLDPYIESQIEVLISSISGVKERAELRESLERYAALHIAIDDEIGQASGQFELFAVSGNGNGATGTPCLYRMNLNKLRSHKVRTADGLIRLVVRKEATNLLSSRLSNFFADFDDLDSITKLEAISNSSEIDDSISLQIAA